MQKFVTGQLSASTSIFQMFLNNQNKVKSKTALNMRLRLISTVCAAFLLCFLSLAMPQFGFARANDFPTPPAGNTWTVSVTLVCPLSTGGEAFYQSLLSQTPAFSGFSDQISLSTNRKVLTYTLSGPSSELPSNVNAAQITVYDADCGGEKNFIVHTDGSGTILLIDEL